MGWLVWSFLTALCVAASWLVAVAVYPDRSTPDRAVVALLAFPALVLTALQVVGVTDHLSPLPLAGMSLALFGSCAAIAYRAAGREAVRAALACDLGAPSRVVRDAWGTREPTALALVPAAIAWVITLIIVWFYKSWSWDPVWYHVPITGYAIQNHSFAWIDTHNLSLQGYPRNVEWLSVWNCIFQRDNRLDDTGQLPFCLLGPAVVAAWSRRLGASRSLAAGVGAAWFALPPVFLQAFTTHVDVAAGALFSATVYFLSFEPSRRNRWMAFLALGLYVGTKYTGAFHAVLLTPWILGRFAVEARVGGWKRLVDLAGSTLLAATLGLYKYLQNFRHTDNPLYPFKTHLPFVHTTWNGPIQIGDLWDAPPGVSPWFFRIPGDFHRMLASWMDATPSYAPDVRSGGFGLVFRWILLPCMAFALVDATVLKSWRKTLPLVLLFVMSVVVPAAWWPRFTIAAASASLIAFATVQSRVKPRAAQRLLATVFVALLALTFKAGLPGYVVFPRYFSLTWLAAPGAERAALQLDAFHWPAASALERENDSREGDVITYDESAIFLAEFFTHDYRTRVTFLSSHMRPDLYLARVRALHARWVGVTDRSLGELALRRAGATLMFSAPLSSCNVWRMPDETLPR